MWQHKAFQRGAVFSTAWFTGVEPGAGEAEREYPCAWIRQAETPYQRFSLALRAFVALLAPGSCQLCQKRLLQATDYPVCEACLDLLQAWPLASACPVCAEPMAPEALHAAESVETRNGMCPACTAELPQFVRATAFGLYDDLRPAIRLMKFEGVPSLAKPLGTMLACAMLRLRVTAPASLLVLPVPLYRGKRSYNQSTLLARSAIAAIQKLDPTWDLALKPALLRRTRSTESQFLLSPAQRHSNLKGAFQADSAVCGHDVLLIDDVYTTGATARECTRTLLAAGAASVHVATLARAGRDVAVRWRMPMQSLATSKPVYSQGNLMTPRTR